LNPTSLIPAAQSDALLQEIEQQSREECRTLVSVAEHEAHAVVAQARATARKRMHEAIEGLRREGARRLARAEAQVETQARQRAQQSALDVISRAWPLLVEALRARWNDRDGRAAWISGAARHARDRLRANTWTVEHPVGWSADEQQLFSQALGGREVVVSFLAESSTSAGLRIKAGAATLDATAQGLLTDRSAVASMLLAEIDAAASDTSRLQGGNRR
jgi:vacuolar-type H+-ATPase subunit E/Vma4